MQHNVEPTSKRRTNGNASVKFAVCTIIRAYILFIQVPKQGVACIVFHSESVQLAVWITIVVSAIVV